MASKRRIARHSDGKHEVWIWPKAAAVERGEWPWPNFTPIEMACRKTGVLLISPQFMDDIQHIRKQLGYPLPVSSGYRSPEHNAAVSSTRAREGPHVDGQAVDIQVGYDDAAKLIAIAFQQHFAGIGLLQHGHPRQRFVHLDAWFKRPRQICWTYDQFKDSP